MARFELGGREIGLVRTAPELTLFLTSRPDDLSATADRAAAVGGAPHRTTGWVGGVERELEIRSAPPGFLLTLPGSTRLSIGSDGRIERLRSDGSSLDALPDPPPWSDDDRELLLGPGLVLALALQGTWCLHASAAVREGAVVTFVGESGVGKSTLAAHLGEFRQERAQDGWHLVADDILPVTAEVSGGWAWPRFPQRKIAPDAQPGLALPEQLPLALICDLAPAAPEGAPVAARLPEAAAATALLRQTAGARLFDADLLEAHLAFAAELAARVPVYRLAVPRRLTALEEVRGCVEGLLAWHAAA